MDVEQPSSGAIRGRPARRAELLDAAIRAIRREGPSVSMETIAAEAGITKPVVYRHFGDKDGLYRALAERYIADLMGELETALASIDDPRQRIEVTIGTYLKLVERDPGVYRFLTRTVVADWSEGADHLAGFVHRIAGRISEVLTTQFIRLGLPARGADAYAHGLVGMVRQAGDWWVEDGSYERTELAHLLTNWIWWGFTGLGRGSE